MPAQGEIHTPQGKRDGSIRQDAKSQGVECWKNVWGLRMKNENAGQCWSEGAEKEATGWGLIRDFEWWELEQKKDYMDTMFSEEEEGVKSGVLWKEGNGGVNSWPWDWGSVTPRISASHLGLTL